jgi:hypothetical protein
MACGCSKGRATANQRAGAPPASGGGTYVYEVTYNDGEVQQFATESEAMGALSMTGGGMRMVPRSK